MTWNRPYQNQLSPPISWPYGLIYCQETCSAPFLPHFSMDFIANSRHFICCCGGLAHKLIPNHSQHQQAALPDIIVTDGNCEKKTEWALGIPNVGELNTSGVQGAWGTAPYWGASVAPTALSPLLFVSHVWFACFSRVWYIGFVLVGSL